MQQAQRMQQRGPAQNWIGALQDQLRSIGTGAYAGRTATGAGRSRSATAADTEYLVDRPR